MEKLCAMEPRLQLERFTPQVGLELWTTRSVGQLLTTELLGLQPKVMYTMANSLGFDQTAF